MANAKWKMKIRIELIGMYKDDAAGLGVLLKILENQDRESPVDSTVWIMLDHLTQRSMLTHLRTYTDAIISEERSRRLGKKCKGICSACSQDGIGGSGRKPA